jgi:hypothetical protein
MIAATSKPSPRPGASGGRPNLKPRGPEPCATAPTNRCCRASPSRTRRVRFAASAAASSADDRTTSYTRASHASKFGKCTTRPDRPALGAAPPPQSSREKVRTGKQHDAPVAGIIAG